jgi:hypothetical protein
MHTFSSVSQTLLEVLYVSGEILDMVTLGWTDRVRDASPACSGVSQGIAILNWTDYCVEGVAFVHVCRLSDIQFGGR